MCWEFRKRSPRHRVQRKPLVSDPGMHHGTCVTHMPWCKSGSLTRRGGEKVPGIPGACATRNFTYLVTDPLKRIPHYWHLVRGVPLLPEYSPHKVPIMRSFDVSSVVSFGKLWTNRLRLYMFTQFMIAKLNGQSAGKCIYIIFRMTNTGCQVWVWNSQTSHWGYNSTRQQLIDQRVYVWCYLWNISENIWRLPQNMPLGKITWV